jgi:hypothetical protein
MTNCPIPSTNRYMADYVEVDYSVSKGMSKYNYFNNFKVEYGAENAIEVIPSTPMSGNQTNTGGTYANEFTAPNPDTISGKVRAKAAQGADEYLPKAYKLKFTVSDTSAHTKITSAKDMNVIIKYKVTYLANGGTGTMTPSIFRYNQTANLKANAFTRVGYEYQGWSRQTSGTIEPNSKVNYSDGKTDEIKLFAQWKAKSYKISLVSSNATANGTSSISVTYDSTTISPKITNPKRIYTITFAKGNATTISSTKETSNWTFDGWYTSDGKKIIGNDGNLAKNVLGYTDASGNWKYDGNLTLYAHWSGGTITIPTTTRTGYTCTFGTVTNPPTANKTYTASCTANNYTVTYNGGSCGTPSKASMTVTYDSKYGTLATSSKT